MGYSCLKRASCSTSCEVGYYGPFIDPIRVCSCVGGGAIRISQVTRKISPVRVAAIVIALLLTLVVGFNLFGESPTPDISQPPSVAAGGADAQGEITIARSAPRAEPERFEVEGRDPISTLRVRDSSGAPMVNAQLHSADRVPTPFLGKQSPSLAVADSKGMISFRSDSPVAVCADGFVPLYCGIIAPGVHREVTLHRGQSIRAVVSSTHGGAVAGIRVSVSVSSLSEQQSEAMQDGARVVFSSGDMSFVSASAVSNADGEVLFSGLPPGNFFVTVHTEGRGFILDNPEDCIQFASPSRGHSIRLRPVFGVAVGFKGGSVLAVKARKGGGPFFGPITRSQASPIVYQNQRLRSRFPGARVIIGPLRDDLDPRVATVGVVVLLASGQTRFLEAPLVRVDQIREVWTAPIDAGNTGGSSACRATVCAATAGSDVPGGRFPSVIIRAAVDGEIFEWKAKVGDVLALPRGTVYVMCDRRVLEGAFETFQVLLGSSQQELTVPFKGLIRYDLDVRLPGGAVPGRVGFAYRRVVGGKSSSTFTDAAGGRHAFWSTSRTVKLRVFVGGYKARRVEMRVPKGEVLPSRVGHRVELEANS